MTEDEQFEEMGPLIDALFDMSIQFVTKFGNFLPHGAALNSTGHVGLVGAAGENEITNSEEILPILHEGLRTQTAEWSTRAVGVSENVFIGADMQPAIKVLAEHRDGVSAAFYMPFKKRVLRKPQFDEVIVQMADAEVGGWNEPSIKFPV